MHNKLDIIATRRRVFGHKIVRIAGVKKRDDS